MALVAMEARPVTVLASVLGCVVVGFDEALLMRTGGLGVTDVL